MIKKWRKFLTVFPPKNVSTGTFVITILSAFVLAWWLIVSLKSESDYQTIHTATSVRLQFDQPGTLPVALSKENIYYVAPVSHLIRESNQNGKTLEKDWIIFLVFKKPISIQQFKIDAGGAKLPPHEVKNYSSRHAIISFMGDMAGLVLNIEIEN